MTSDDWTLALLRLVMGAVFFAHGAQKALGWFGGYGFSGTMGFFTKVMHIPAPFAFLAICANLPNRRINNLRAINRLLQFESNRRHQDSKDSKQGVTGLRRLGALPLLFPSGRGKTWNVV